MNDDPWLDRWMPLVAQRAGALPVLELGCGAGLDTAVLCEAGHRVIALDLAPASIAKAKARAPAAQLHCQDVRAPFPVGPQSVNVVVASLSLHYFPWDETVALVRRIRAVLCQAGVLLCRLNSTNDHHHGAVGHTAIEQNYYLVDGEPKRFFSQSDVQALFAHGWRSLCLEEKVIHRYVFPKAAWEVVLERTEPA